MPTAGDLPGNTAQWTVDPERAVLLVHDMQRYFLKPIPAVGPGDELVRNATLLRETASALGMPVAYTAQPGGMDEEQRGLLKDFWGPGDAGRPRRPPGRRPAHPGPGGLGVHQVALQRLLPLGPAPEDACGRAATSSSSAASTPTSAC
ncbi:hypothetical protein GCM10020000_19630 [Streptomyces olivoverticillatus]